MFEAKSEIGNGAIIVIAAEVEVSLVGGPKHEVELSISSTEECSAPTHADIAF
jgi:hypothetical protein